jgi:hypothetical protein
VCVCVLIVGFLVRRREYRENSVRDSFPQSVDCNLDGRSAPHLNLITAAGAATRSCSGKASEGITIAAADVSISD